MRFGLVFLAALLSLLIATSAAAFPPPAGDGPAPSKAPKGKKKKCKAGKVPVTINGRGRCASLKSALPRPKAADQRLLAAKAALGVDLSGVRDRRGRPVKTAAQVLGAHRVHIAEGAVKKGLATLDQLQAQKMLSSLATSSGEGCGAGPRGHPELTKSYGGQGLDAKVELDRGAAQIGVDLGGGGIRAELDLGLCDIAGDKFKADECPDAQGNLEGSDESLMFIGIRIIRGADLLFSQSVKFTAKTTVQPIQVDQDAKLEYFEIDHTYRTSLELGGSTQAFSRISLKTTYHGHTRVTYPGAEYDPTNTDVEVRLDISGVDDAQELRDEEFDQSLRAKPEADKNFAAEVDKVIGKLAQREQDWNQPNHCASIKFDPASETLTLEKGNTGLVGVKLEAKRGGAPQGAKWTLGDPQNATIAPDKALANPAAFNYTVTNAGEGIEVRGTWKAVSQAGVAEGTWVQKTRKPRPPPAKKFAGPVSGTAQYDSSLLGEGNSLDAEWSGNVTLKQEPPLFEIPGVPITSWNYKLVSGSITYSFSGSIGECHVEGSEPIDLGAQFDLTSSFSLTIMEGEPRPYQFFLPMPLFAKVNGTASACKDPEDEGPTEFIPAAGIPAIVNAPLTLGGTLAADESFSGSNSGDTGGGTPDQTWQWAMAPVP